MARITNVRTHDLGFPTSGNIDGSDAMLFLNPTGEHHGDELTFTIGCGNVICVATIEALGALGQGMHKPVWQLVSDMPLKK